MSVFEKIKWRVNRASLLGDSGPSAGKPSCHEIDGIVVAGTELDDEVAADTYPGERMIKAASVTPQARHKRHRSWNQAAVPRRHDTWPQPGTTVAYQCEPASA